MPVGIVEREEGDARGSRIGTLRASCEKVTSGVLLHLKLGPTALPETRVGWQTKKGWKGSSFFCPHSGQRRGGEARHQRRRGDRQNGPSHISGTMGNSGERDDEGNLYANMAAQSSAGSLSVREMQAAIGALDNGYARSFLRFYSAPPLWQIFAPHIPVFVVGRSRMHSPTPLNSFFVSRPGPCSTRSTPSLQAQHRQQP